ncbi:MAG: hypothetical protein HKL90_09490 [Elusimicrobia bacterium]|nr:hypothetical protein [Elusimicrobiota bacterium]
MRRGRGGLIGAVILSCFDGAFSRAAPLNDGKNPHPLTKQPAKAYEYCGNWFPDRKQIAYISADAGGGQFPLNSTSPFLR